MLVEIIAKTYQIRQKKYIYRFKKLMNPKQNKLNGENPQINETKSWFFDKFNTSDKMLAWLTKKREDINY